MRELVGGVVGLMMACSGGSNEPPIDAAPDVAITGDVTIVPMDLDFGMTTVGTTGSVMIANGTNVTISITSILLGEEYTISPAACMAVPLEPGASCVLPITVAELGSNTSALTVVSTAGTVFGQVDAQPSGTITVVVDGNGTVTSDPSGIDCGQVCSLVFGTSPLLTATPAAGSTFVMWSDPTCGTSSTCRLLVPATITATFAASLAGPP